MEGAEGRGGDQGITQRSIKELFTKIEETKANQGNMKHFSVFVSYLQIYNEKVFDLLNPNLTVQKGRGGGTNLDA